MPDMIELIATVLFAIAIVHTFSVPFFARKAHEGGPHSGLWHVFSEVEAVFGLWASILIIFMGVTGGLESAVKYMDSRNFTEPLFVFAIMVVAASRPILVMVGTTVRYLARVLPLQTSIATFFLTLTLVPLAGSFITEPAAMTLAALLLKRAFFDHSSHTRFKYMAVGVLFVNISIGGVLTSYAAPPVLMVASSFGWDSVYMATHFGWKAAIAVVINASALTFLMRKELVVAGEHANEQTRTNSDERAPVPWFVILIHLAFLASIVIFAHHPAVFIGLMMLFVGYCSAYEHYQDKLMIKEALMVAFFLAGLIVLGGLQQWWLQDLLAGLSPALLYWGATALTAITDNAALTYLGSLVEGTNEVWRYMLVAGAVTGGGLTVIANAPNPAGFSILKGCFPDEAISPKYLLLAALVPTLVAAAMFLLPVQLLGNTGL